MDKLNYQCPECGARIVISEEDADLYRCIGCSVEYALLYNGEKRPQGFARKVREPLNMPRGSVRALVALLLTWALFYHAARGIVPPELLTSLLISIIFYYFGFRKTEAKVHVGGKLLEIKTGAPLNLPRGFVRSFLVVGFIASFVFYLSRGIIPENLLGLFIIFLSLVAGYFYAKHFHR